MQPINVPGMAQRIRSQLQAASERATHRWRQLPPQRRSALASLALLTLLLAALLMWQQPGDPPPATSEEGPRPVAMGRLEEPIDPLPEPAAPAAPSPANTAEKAPDAAAEADQPAAAGSAAGDAKPPTLDSLTRPLKGEVIRDYGWAYFPDMGDWRLHTGLDYRAAPGADVHAAAAGRVEAISEDPLYGRTVTLNHGGSLRTHYAGLGQLHVTLGEQVRAGQLLGHVGTAGPAEQAMGPHLHFVVEQDEAPVTPGAPLR